MISRVSGLIHRLAAPRSLRKQLLAISILILSGLLLLIGVFQYFLMRDFIYTNRAESMETQMRSVPRELFFNFLNYKLPDGDSVMGSFSNETDTSKNGKSLTPKTPNGGMRYDEGRRPLLLDAHTTIAIYSSDGTFRDFQDETLSDLPAPRLSDEEYKTLLAHTTERATVNTS